MRGVVGAITGALLGLVLIAAAVCAQEADDSFEAPRVVKRDHPRIRVNGPFDRCTVAVQVTAVVDEKGRVTDVTMDYSAVTWSERAGFAFAMQMIKDWIFEPTTVGGEPVRSAVTFPLTLVKDGVTPEAERLAPGSVLDLCHEVPEYLGRWKGTPVTEEGGTADSTRSSNAPSGLKVAARLVKADWPSTESYWLREDLDLQMGAIVRRDGTVGETWILSPPGRDYRVLEKACLDAAKKWRFRPARQDGQPVEFKLMIPFVYSFSDDRWSYAEFDSL